MHRTVSVLSFVIITFSGCAASVPSTSNTQATYQARTAAYQLIVTEELRSDQCIKRTLRFEARGGLHSRPHVNRAIAKDRDCDMTIDRVRIPRNPDRRMFKLQRMQIRRDFRKAYYKAMMQ